MFEPNQEYKRGQTRDKLGLFIHSSENVKRTPNRSAEAAKVGLNILLLALVICGWVNMFNLALTPFTAGLAMIYVLCFLICKPENPKEL